MSKKRKCANCDKRMDWALPVRVGEQNIDYARHCLRLAERTFVCGITMKTKRIEHEQYCKHYREDTERGGDCMVGEISRLRRMIMEYERRHRDWKDNFMSRFMEQG